MISCVIYHKRHHVIRGDTHSNFNKMLRNWVAFSRTQEPFQKSSLGNPHGKTELPSPCEASLLTQLFTYNWVLFPPKFILEVSASNIYTSIIGSKADSALYSVYTHSELKQTGVQHKQDPGFQYPLHFLSATLCYLLWRPGSNYRLVWCCQSVV